jgi:hypothetical protein
MRSLVTRAAVAGALIVAFVALPLAMNLCAASCEAHRALADAAAPAPACHHAATPSASIGRTPMPCGYGHADRAFVAPAGPDQIARPLTSPAAVPMSAAIGTRPALHAPVEEATPPLRSVPHALSSTLRI